MLGLVAFLSLLWDDEAVGRDPRFPEGAIDV